MINKTRLLRCYAKPMRCRASELAIGVTWYDTDAMGRPLKSGSTAKKFSEDHEAWR
jgi:hypothetical protein